MLNALENVRRFRNERHWLHPHKEKDLALSISLEAAELLELFQWKTSEEAIAQKKKELAEELADVFIYAYMLADNLDLDVDEIVEKKLQKNAERYPAQVLREHPESYAALRASSRAKLKHDQS